MTEGNLPKDIEEVIKTSKKTICIEALQIWFRNRGIRFRINNRGKYCDPTLNQIEKMVTETIKQYYYDGINDYEYCLDEDITAVKYQEIYLAGFKLINSGDHFEVNFFITHYSEIMNKLVSVYYSDDVKQFTSQN